MPCAGRWETPSPDPGTCGLTMLTLAGNISEQLYWNSCGELSQTREATGCPHRHGAQGGPCVCRGLPDSDKVLTAARPCQGSLASPQDSQVSPRPWVRPPPPSPWWAVKTSLLIPLEFSLQDLPKPPGTY